jgi:DnaK suppressor protein
MMDENRIRKRLLRFKNEILENISALGEDDLITRGANPTRGDLAKFYDLQQRHQGLLYKARKDLNAIERALIRLDEGQYGMCVNCSRKIKKERLKIVPYAQYCVACKKDIEG